MFVAFPSQGTYRFTFLRHGESEGNARGFVQGQHDYPLSKTGQEQALALTNRWLSEGITFDLVITSSLTRAVQTAEIITAGLDLPLEVNPVWMERNNGVLAGKHADEIARLYPRPAFIHLYQPIGDTGESQWDLYLRAGQAVQELLRRSPGRYLIVSHGGLLNLVLYAILGITPQANLTGARFRFRNTAFANLLYNPATHEWLVESLNDRAHWPDDGA